MFSGISMLSRKRGWECSLGNKCNEIKFVLSSQECICVCISHKHDTQTTHLTYIYPLAHPQCFRMLVHVKVDEKKSAGGRHQWGEEQVSPARQRERTRAACLGWVLAPPVLHSPGRTGDIWPLCLCSRRLFLQGRQLLLNLWALSQYGKM